MTIFDVAVIPGDGIGPEVITEAQQVLDLAAKLDGGFQFRYTEFDWSCAYYLKHGRMMPEDGIRQLADFPLILLGAVGFPTVADHISLWGLLLPIRREFDQYVNLRPVRLLRGIVSPLRDPGKMDFVVIRENTEGEYSNVGGRLRQGTDQEIAIQTGVFTRMGTERVIRYAFELARKMGKSRVTGATKSNGLSHSMPFWDEVFRRVAAEYPECQSELVHIDALSAFFVTKPHTFEVVVASNLFGDILTDLGGAIQGGIGIAASANLNPEGRYPSMFEPVHGSAPDIAGKGVANPMGALWTAALMLEHLGKMQWSNRLLAAIEQTLLAGVATGDLGGTATTRQFGDRVRDAMGRLGG